MILLFRNINNDVIEVETTLFESPVKQRWYALLQNVLNNDFITYVKTFSLVGNFSKNRTPQMIVKELVEGIEMLKNAEWYPDYGKITDYIYILRLYKDKFGILLLS